MSDSGQVKVNAAPGDRIFVCLQLNPKFLSFAYLHTPILLLINILPSIDLFLKNQCSSKYLEMLT